MIAPIYAPPLEPPYPRWYEANAKCEYHGGATGHLLENCTAFKRRVQSMRDVRVLNFEQEKRPNVSNNPLPKHQEDKAH
ncbi:hypothetical protein PTKIN_Ptkin03bG0123800 [Pterospermum kingtungense]